MSSESESKTHSFSEPKTHREWSHLRKRMKVLRPEDHPEIDSKKFEEFRRAATSEAPYYKGIIIGLMIWVIPLILIKIAERIFQFRAGAVFYLALIFLILSGIAIQGSLARKHQKKIVELGKNAGVIK